MKPQDSSNSGATLLFQFASPQLDQFERDLFKQHASGFTFRTRESVTYYQIPGAILAIVQHNPYLPCCATDLETGEYFEFPRDLALFQKQY